MRCPFCAEEIRDEAILCRFCGARKEGEAWKPPASPMSSSVPRAMQPSEPRERAPRAGSLTRRGAGAMLVASALFEFASPCAAVPLFGAVRVGATALAYHVAFATLFLVMGIGLLMLRPFGYRLLFLGTALYTIDRTLWLLDRSAQEAYISQQLPGYEDVVDKGALLQVLLLTGLVLLACWWGFAAYVYFRRAAFEPPAKPSPR